MLFNIPSLLLYTLKLVSNNGKNVFFHDVKYALQIEICAIIEWIKKYKSIIKEKKKHDKIVLVGKTKLNAIAILVSKALIDSCISHDEFVSVNNMLREYNEMKEEIKKSWNFCGIYYVKAIETVSSALRKILRTKIQVLQKLNRID